jgi:hypothetical protein
LTTEGQAAGTRARAVEGVIALWEHVIKRRAAAFRAVRAWHRAFEIRPEQLEIHHRIQSLQTVALGRELLQPLVNVEKPRLSPHPHPPMRNQIVASQTHQNHQVFGGLHLPPGRLTASHARRSIQLASVEPCHAQQVPQPAGLCTRQAEVLDRRSSAEDRLTCYGVKLIRRPHRDGRSGAWACPKFARYCDPSFVTMLR